MKEEEPIKKEEESNNLQEAEKNVAPTERDIVLVTEKEQAMEESSPSVLNEVKIFSNSF